MKGVRGNIMNSKMDNHSSANNLVTFVAWLILVVGIIGGLIIAFTKAETTGYYYTREEYSVLNIGIGFATIISSIFIFAICNWMVKHLECQQNQLYYLQVITERKMQEATEKEEV